jgi:hypothetical protein
MWQRKDVGRKKLVKEARAGKRKKRGTEWIEKVCRRYVGGDEALRIAREMEEEKA